MGIFYACIGMMLLILLLPYILRPVFIVILWFVEQRMLQEKRRGEYLTSQLERNKKLL